MQPEPLSDLDEIRRMTEAVVEAERREFAQDPDPDLEPDSGKNGKDKEGSVNQAEADFSEYHLSDLGLAKRFIGYHGGKVRYCYPWQSWLYFDGCRWIRDNRGEVPGLIKDTVSKVYAEAANSPNDERRKAVAKFALSAESEAKRKAAFISAQSEPGIPIMPDELDRDPWLFNGINGIQDLRAGQLLTRA